MDCHVTQCEARKDKIAVVSWFSFFVFASVSEAIHCNEGIWVVTIRAALHHGFGLFFAMKRVMKPSMGSSQPWITTSRRARLAQSAVCMREERSGKAMVGK